MLKINNGSILKISTILILLVALFIFNVGGVFGMPRIQADKIDSLLNKLDKVTDTSKINLLNNLSEEFFYINTDSSLLYANQALNLSENNDYKKLTGKIVWRVK